MIVDDVLYFNESPFQDGPIAQAVNAVTADGALYFSSAGNEGNTLDGTSGNYEGDFVGSGRTVGKFAGEAHDFDPGPGRAGVRAGLRRVQRRRAGHAVLGRPARRAADDYDLYLFDAAGNVVSFSQDVQNGDDDPYEILGTPFFGGSGLQAGGGQVLRGRRSTSSCRALRGRFSNSADADGLRDPGRHARALGGRLRVQRGGRAGGRPAAVRSRAGRSAEPVRAVPGRVHGASRSRSASPPTGRGGCSSRRRSPAPEAGHHGRRRRLHVAGRTSRRSSAPRPRRRTRRRSPRSCCPATRARASAEVREAFNATALDLAPAGVDARTGHGLLRADQRARLHRRDAAAAGQAPATRR